MRVLGVFVFNCNTTSERDVDYQSVGVLEVF